MYDDDDFDGVQYDTFYAEPRHSYKDSSDEMTYEDTPLYYVVMVGTLYSKDLDVILDAVKDHGGQDWRDRDAVVAGAVDPGVRRRPSWLERFGRWIDRQDWLEITSQ